MDLHPSFEQVQLRETLRLLFDRRLADLVSELPERPRHDHDRALDDARAVGLLALGLPEDVGGAGDFADLVVAHEELGRGLAAPLLTTLSLAGRLLVHASGDERERLLEGLAAGRLTVAPAVAEEPDPHAAITTTATAVGDEVRIDGRKRRVVGGREVDELVVVARDSSTGDPTAVSIPVDSSGMQWSPEQCDTDIAHWSVTFSGATVPATRVVTFDAEGLASYDTEAIVLGAARQLGGGRAVLDRTLDHVRTREQFGRPIGTFQAVQHQLADVATDLDAAALAVAQAGWALREGSIRPGTTARRLAAVAALATGSAFRRATLVAHQLHGGMGFVLDSPLHLWSARAVADPTTPYARRHLLDDLAAASGITPDAVGLPADHRAGG